MSRSRTLAALCAAGSALGLANAAMGQITFNVPADAPNGGVGTVGVLEVTGNGGIGDQAAARTSLGGGAGTRLTGQRSFVDFHDSDGSGHFTNNLRFLSDPDQVDPGNDTVNDISIMYRGRVQVPAPGGIYTIGVNSDDGFTVAFNNGATPWVPASNINSTLETYNGNVNGALQFFGGRGSADSLGQVTLTPGVHQLDMTFHEGGGGATVELFAAPGPKTGFDDTFNLIGGPALPGAPAIPPRPSKVNTVGPWQLREYTSSGGALTLQTVVDSGRNAGGVGTGNAVLRATNNVQSIRYTDPSGANVGGHAADAAPFPGDTPGDNNDYGAYATASLTITAADAGPHTFLIFADDNSAMRVIAAGGDAVELTGIAGGNTDQFDSPDDADAGNDSFGDINGCCADVLGQYTLAAGTYTLEAAFQEGGGGSGFMIYGAKGTHTAFNTTDFDLVGGFPGVAAGNPTPAGLALVPEPGTLSLFGLAGLGMLARRARRRAH